MGPVDVDNFSVGCSAFQEFISKKPLLPKENATSQVPSPRMGTASKKECLKAVQSIYEKVVEVSREAHNIKPADLPKAFSSVEATLDSVRKVKKELKKKVGNADSGKITNLVNNLDVVSLQLKVLKKEQAKSSPVETSNKRREITNVAASFERIGKKR